MWKCKWEFWRRGSWYKIPPFYGILDFVGHSMLSLDQHYNTYMVHFLSFWSIPSTLYGKEQQLHSSDSSFLFYKRKSVIHVWVHKLWRSFHFLVNYSLKITLQGWKNQISLLWDAFHMIYWGLSSPDMETACAKSLMYIVTISLCVTAALSVERFFAVSDDFKCHTRRC